VSTRESTLPHYSPVLMMANNRIFFFFSSLAMLRLMTTYLLNALIPSECPYIFFFFSSLAMLRFRNDW
jgi:hypothetical protein